MILFIGNENKAWYKCQGVTFSLVLETFSPSGSHTTPTRDSAIEQSNRKNVKENYLIDYFTTLVQIRGTTLLLGVQHSGRWPMPWSDRDSKHAHLCQTGKHRLVLICISCSLMQMHARDGAKGQGFLTQNW